MEVRLTPDQEALIRRAIEAGRFGRAEDAVEEALVTLEDAKASIARGEGHVITQQSMRDLPRK